jgi:hypothetical protein
VELIGVEALVQRPLVIVWRIADRAGRQLGSDELIDTVFRITQRSAQFGLRLRRLGLNGTACARASSRRASPPSSDAMERCESARARCPSDVSLLRRFM